MFTSSLCNRHFLMSSITVIFQRLHRCASVETVLDPVHSLNSHLFLLTQCADQKVEALCEALQATVQQWRGRFPSPLPLELYTSSNFIGLFVEEQVADILKQFAADFAAEAVRKAGRKYKRKGYLHPSCQSVPSFTVCLCQRHVTVVTE